MIGDRAETGSSARGTGRIRALTIAALTVTMLSAVVGYATASTGPEDGSGVPDTPTAAPVPPKPAPECAGDTTWCVPDTSGGRLTAESDTLSVGDTVELSESSGSARWGTGPATYPPNTAEADATGSPNESTSMTLRSIDGPPAPFEARRPGAVTLTPVAACADGQTSCSFRVTRAPRGGDSEATWLAAVVPTLDGPAAMALLVRPERFVVSGPLAAGTGAPTLIRAPFELVVPYTQTVAELADHLAVTDAGLLADNPDIATETVASGATVLAPAAHIAATATDDGRWAAAVPPGPWIVSAGPVEAVVRVVDRDVHSVAITASPTTVAPTTVPTTVPELPAPSAEPVEPPPAVPQDPPPTGPVESGPAPSVRCTWALPDMDSDTAVLDYTDANSRSDDQAVDDASLAPCSLGTGGPTMADQSRHVTAVRPNLDDAPRVRQLALWAALTGNAGASATPVRFEVTDPEGRAVASVVGQMVTGESGAAPLSSCAAARPALDAAQRTGQVDPAAASDSANGITAGCQRGSLVLATATVGISRLLPCGEYHLTATGGGSRIESTFDVACVVGVRSNFASISWGDISAGAEHTAVAQSPDGRPVLPTVTNVGNTPLRLSVRFSPMRRDGAVETGESGFTFGAWASPTPARRRSVTQIHPGVTRSFGTFTLCPGDHASVGFSVEVARDAVPGHYSGDVAMGAAAAPNGACRS